MENLISHKKFFIILLMLPWIIGWVFLFLFPLIMSSYYSFTNFNVLNKPKWIGFENYIFALTKDPYFWKATRNTLWVIVVSTPLRVILALMITFLIYSKKRFKQFSLVIITLPIFLPAVATLLGFKRLFNPVNGLINIILQKIGFEHPPMWFVTSDGSRWGFILLSLWGVGDALLLYVAGVTRLDSNLFKAARIDDVSELKQFTHIALPLLSPLILYSTVVGVITSSQNFTSSYVLNSSGDNSSVLYFLSSHIYVQGYRYFYMGYASTLGWIMTFMLALIIGVVLFSKRYWVYEPKK